MNKNIKEHLYYAEIIETLRHISGTLKLILMSVEDECGGDKSRTDELVSALCLYRKMPYYIASLSLVENEVQTVRHKFKN